MFLKNTAAFLEHLVNGIGIPGVALNVYKDHELVFSYGCGIANTEKKLPFTPSTVVRLFSSSKVISCAAAMTLHEKGLFLMQDPLYEYIPEFRDVTVKVKKEDGSFDYVKPKKAITIKNLFNMTCGFDYNLSPESIEELKSRPDCSTVDFAKAVAREPLHFHPGEKWMYGMSHEILGAVVEVITGKSIADYAKEAIFDRCGMKISSYRNKPELLSRLADAYTCDRNSMTFTKADSNDLLKQLPKNVFFAGGSVISNCEEAALFSDAMACEGMAKTGERILSPLSVELMHTNCLPESVRRSTFTWSPNEGYGYGFGVRTMMDKVQGSSLSPVGEFGWAGAAGTNTFIDTTNHFSMFYTQHVSDSNLEDYVFPRLRNVVYADCGELLCK